MKEKSKQCLSGYTQNVYLWLYSDCVFVAVLGLCICLQLENFCNGIIHSAFMLHLRYIQVICTKPQLPTSEEENTTEQNKT